MEWKIKWWLLVFVVRPLFFLKHYLFTFWPPNRWITDITLQYSTLNGVEYCKVMSLIQRFGGQNVNNSHLDISSCLNTFHNDLDGISFTHALIKLIQSDVHPSHILVMPFVTWINNISDSMLARFSWKMISIWHSKRIKPISILFASHRAVN